MSLIGCHWLSWSFLLGTSTEQNIEEKRGWDQSRSLDVYHFLCLYFITCNISLIIITLTIGFGTLPAYSKFLKVGCHSWSYSAFRLSLQWFIISSSYRWYSNAQLGNTMLLGLWRLLFERIRYERKNLSPSYYLPYQTLPSATAEQLRL